MSQDRKVPWPKRPDRNGWDRNGQTEWTWLKSRVPQFSSM